jgi:DNA-directed RNA polymerase
MELLTQVEVERRMYYGGIKRAENMMARAEEQGRAASNPYSKELLREYVMPMAKALAWELDDTAPGAKRAHVRLLAGLEPEAVSLLAVRTAINACFDPRVTSDDRTISYKIGTAIHAELVLSQIELEYPELYFTLTRDLARRMSKNERHRVTTIRMQAEAAGFFVPEWPVGSREQVGSFLLGMLVTAGMIEIGEAPIANGKRGYRPVALSQEIMDRIAQVKSYVAMTAPTYGPCVEPPLDWESAFGGGFHTRELRKAHPLLVACSASARHLYRDVAMPVVLSAVNALQRTAWQVNEAILDVVLGLSAANVTTDEIVSTGEQPRPPKPSWLTPDFDKSLMSGAQEVEFLAWKRLMNEWYTQRKLLGSKFGRFYSATRAADMFRGYPTLYFVYFADSRGRLYPMTYGVNPQGSDLQKALLRFSVGKPLADDTAVGWFLVQGANKWGFDKATLEERQQWVRDRHEFIMHFAADPINHRGWLDAACPLQFLAWCLEYREWQLNPDTFLSRLPISMDGSCNGLQNLSAMLRDEVGGRATNLTANAVMEDIYRRVAQAAEQRLLSMTPEDAATASLRQRWLSHGISRSVVKRSVMTTPYGVTLRSATDYVIEDYLKVVKDHPFEKQEYRKAAAVLMTAVWPAIGDVVVKGRQAMDYLRKAARLIVKENSEDEPIIWWTSPSGFPASQAYFEVEVHRINTRLIGPEKIRVLSETDEASPTKHASGLAPNFVHSCDAAHLHLTAAAAASAGIDSLAMIHDDYGTHAADAQKLYDLIRSEFVAMYEKHSPLQELRAKYPFLPAPPANGTLDIREVLQSKFFFS